jgi:hypothetical protein
MICMHKAYHLKVKIFFSREPLNNEILKKQDEYPTSQISKNGVVINQYSAIPLRLY